MKKKANKTKIKKSSIIVLCIMAVLLVALIVGDCVCGFYSGAITTLLCGSGITFDGEDVEQALAVSDELVQDISEEGIIMLKNNGTLPLEQTNKKVNLFGWASTGKTNGYFYTGGGSGAGTIQADKRSTPIQAFEANGFEINYTLRNAYTSFCGWRPSSLTLVEPSKDFYTAERIQQCKDFSDTAIVFISRYGSEGVEIPLTQTRYNLDEDTTRTYLQISEQEEDMIDIVTENFDKVIVLFNTCNPMEMGFIENEKIDAALYLGVLGQSGTKAVPKILTGEVNPSARTVDTHPYSHESNPSFANKRKNGDHIVYQEGIYVGYKWYETAAVEGYFNSVDNEYGKGYDGVVQYPFGYGLSYTDFEWEVKSISTENQVITNKSTTVTVEVDVTNTGSVAGKEVVQLYATTPYIEGGIEKPHVTLVDFEKTALLEPTKTQTLTLNFDLYDLASYDAYDKNNNGTRAWELDAGTYTLKLMNNAHELNACEKAETTFEIASTIRYKRDPDTKRIVKNRFTGDSAYAGVPIDGNATSTQSFGSTITYLSRADFAGTFAPTQVANRDDEAIAKSQKYRFDGYDEVAAPTTGANSNMYLYTKEDGTKASVADLEGTSGNTVKPNEELIETLSNYNAPEWEAFLDQCTATELFHLVECSGYRNDAMASVGKPKIFDLDGPSGFRTNIGSFDEGKWTGFPGQATLAATWNKSLAFQVGRGMANEANATGVGGWYAPGVNLHRSPYNGRYFEYYSEDGVLSGYMGAYVIKGSKSLNVYCYLKHFALSEMGINPLNLNVWLTEQTLRETYLRPFEICVKDGEANAMMSAFNRVGSIWAGGSKPLLTDILRNEWGFRGVVLTDWSTGSAYMNPSQGVRAGNDMWLNPNDWNGASLDRSNATDLYLARNAAKNMIYTICDTYQYYKNYDASGDTMFNATVGVKQYDKVFPWWIPILVALNLAVVGVIVWQVLRIFLPKKNKEENK